MLTPQLSVESASSGCRFRRSRALSSCPARIRSLRGMDSIKFWRGGQIRERLKPGFFGWRSGLRLRADRSAQACGFCKAAHGAGCGGVVEVVLHDVVVVGVADAVGGFVHERFGAQAKLFVAPCGQVLFVQGLCGKQVPNPAPVGVAGVGFGFGQESVGPFVEGFRGEPEGSGQKAAFDAGAVGIVELGFVDGAEVRRGAGDFCRDFWMAQLEASGAVGNGKPGPKGKPCGFVERCAGR